jgi:hypothetical protein
MRRQRPKADRRRLSATADAEIDRQIRMAARMFKCSKSFVQAVALADFFGIRLEERYDVPADKPVLTVVRGRKRA